MSNGSYLPVIIVSMVLALPAFIMLPMVREDASGSIAFETDTLINSGVSDGFCDDPEVVVDGNHVYVVYQDNRNGNWDLFCRVSHNGGLTFLPEVRVDDTARTSNLADDIADQEMPAAEVASDGTVIVVWQDEREGRPLIYMATSNDRGATFSSNEAVSYHVLGSQTTPSISMTPDDEVQVAWEDTRDRVGYPQIYTARSEDGSSFGSAVRVSDVSTNFKCFTPSVTTPSNEHVHITWSDDRVWDSDVYIANSDDSGSSFGSSIRINRDPSGSDQTEPVLVSNSTRVICVWKDPRSTSSDIYMAVSEDHGETWTMDTVVHPNNTVGHQFNPDIKMDETGNVTFCWTSSPGMADSRSDIEMTRLFSNGTFDRVYTVNDPVTDTVQDKPAMDVTSTGTAHFVWRDTRREDHVDIYYTRTTQSGEEGYAPVLTNTTISPKVGTTGENYQFTVTYSDVENDAPMAGYPKLHLFYRSAGDNLFSYPGSPFNMSKRMMPLPDSNYQNGEVYIFKLDIDRDLDLFHYFSARASFGNSTEVKTDLVNLPVIDSEGPDIKLLDPEKNSWIDRNIVDFTVRLEDDVAGVDPWTFYYRIYHPDRGGWERWQRKGDPVSVDNLTVDMSVSIAMLEGSDNRIQFRCKDLMGNGRDGKRFSESEVYHIWIDSTGPVTVVGSPRSGSVLSDPTVNIMAHIEDEGIGLDPEGVEVSYSVNGVDNFGPWENLSELPSTLIENEYEGGYDVELNLSLTYGYYNFFRFRTRDLLGNIGQSSNVQVIIREEQTAAEDKPPSKVESIQPRVSGSVRPHITWTPSYDPDGTLVRYNITVFDQTDSYFIVQDEQVTLGRTYWDPSVDMQFIAGHTYTIEIVPISEGLKGPSTNSTLLISTDANAPPGEVKGFEPRATSDPRPILRWGPSVDPDGDPVYYFLRIGTYTGASDVLGWTSVLSETRYAMDRNLGPGVYYIDIMCSDGKDFAPISHFTMSIGVYGPYIEPQRPSLVVYMGNGVTINLTVENRGFAFDDIKIELEGEALKSQDIDIILQDDQLEVSSGSSVNTTLHVDASDDAKPGIYPLNITVTSIDGVSSYSTQLSIRIVDPEDVSGAGTESGTEDDSDDAQVLLWLFFVILLAVVAAMGYAYYRIDKRQREELVEIVEDRRKEVSRPKKSKDMEPGKGKKGLKGKRKDKDALPPGED